MERICWMGEKWRPPGCGQLLQLAQQVGVESGRRTVGEKEIRDRMKVLKMGPGDSRPLGSRVVFLGAPSCLFRVLATKRICCAAWSQPPVSLVMSPILLITLNYLYYFFVQGLSPNWRSQTRICFGKTSWCVHKQRSELGLTWHSKVHAVFL